MTSGYVRNRGMRRRSGAHRHLLAGLAALSLAAASMLPAFSPASASVRTPVSAGAASAARNDAASSFGGALWHLRGLGPTFMSSPVVATIDNVRAVVLATLSGEIYVLNARTGTELPGWPRFVHINSSTPTGIESSPAVAYLDGPNEPPSIIVGAGSLYRRYQQGGVEAFYANGNVRFVFQTRRTYNPWGGPDDYSDPVFSTVAVGDITGNGQLDIVFGSYDHFLYALQPNGRLVPGFPINRADTIWSSPALVDTSHSGRDDIIIGGDASGWLGCRGGWLVDYRYLAGAPRLVWQRCFGQTVWSSPTVGVINGTGRPAVVVGTSFYSGYSSPATDEILAVYADNGDNVPGWPVRARGPTFGSPAIGFLDGQQAVVATSCARCLSGPAVVSAWSGSGRMLWSKVYDAHNEATSSPVLVDLTGGRDDGDDVAVGAAWGLYLLSGRDGSFLYNTGAWASTLGVGCDVPATAAVSYVPGAPGNGWMLYFACGGPTLPATLWAYPLPVAPAAGNVAAAWPEWRGNAERTGIADPVMVPRTSCGPSPSKLIGYRMVTANGQVFERGDLPYCGGLSSSVLPAPVVSMASTPDGKGYWLLLSDGAVYAFGDASWYGDLRGGNWRGGPVPPGAPAEAIASSPNGKGYLVLAGDGSVYAFGDAAYHGSRGGHPNDGVPVGIAVDSKTGGYWIVTAKGAVYGEHAPNRGSATAYTSRSSVVGIAADAGTNGYWLATANGHVYSFGVSHRSAMDPHLASPVVGIAASPTGKGCWIATASGQILHMGGSRWYGQVPAGAHAEAVTAFSAP